MVYMFLADGFEESEAIVPLDMLKRGGVDIKTVSITDNNIVNGSHGIAVMTDITVSEMTDEPLEMVILPGGMPGASNLRSNEAVVKAVTETYNNGGYVAAICAAPYILGELGLLKGKKAICYPSFEDRLVGAEVVIDDVVCDGNVITAIGMGAALKFGYALVSVLKGNDVAHKIAKSIFM